MSEQEQSGPQDHPILPQYKETKWYDAWIRWEKGSKETYDDDDDADDDEPPLIPTDTYHSTYEVPSMDGGDTMTTISLQLKGFPSESEAIWTSTGLTLWRSAEFLCSYLVQHYRKLVPRLQGDRPSRILEVGSGLGRSGILIHLLAYVASQDEAKDADICRRQRVVLTDGDTDVLAQLRSNVQQNLELNATLVQNSSDVNCQESSSDLSCHQLIWGKDHAKAFVQRPCFHSSYRGNNDPDASYFDVIIGSDLIYVAQVIEPLFETIQTLLHPNHGIFLMAHCARHEGNEVELDMVLGQARKVGLQYTRLHPKEDGKTEDESDPEDGIYLYQFEWSTKD
ncbi:MAG: hypothetical protein SGBAC_009271 [Bacillariaceae sp.]